MPDRDSYDYAKEMAMAQCENLGKIAYRITFMKDAVCEVIQANVGGMEDEIFGFKLLMEDITGMISESEAIINDCFVKGEPCRKPK